jgi:hypothetical protein
MAGVLIYTAAPDSEGTLGGLASLGEPIALGRHISQALEQMRLCASDPLCAEHSPLQNTTTLHWATCHACLFSPETSCERGNKYLDRSILVRTVKSLKLNSLFSRTWINFVTVFSERLLAQIRRVAQELPTPTLSTAIEVLMKSESQSSQSLKAKLLSGLPKASWRSVVAELIEIWQVEATHLDGKAIASALATAAHCETASRQELSAQLVWTGPNPEGTPLRRTDQTLLQMIREAKEELILVSFAVYKIPEIAQELIAARTRGVSLRIIAKPQSRAKARFLSSHRRSRYGILNFTSVYWRGTSDPLIKMAIWSLHVKCDCF